MREKCENTFQEIEAAFAFAVLLLNFLVLAAVFGLVWLLKSLVLPNSPLSAALSETIWR
ncbi:MAG: hypothetical protein M3Q99_06260 [Acidobacteriota bacterium]|nr:hypothetical protein [Acidobacteriota bacterium]